MAVGIQGVQEYRLNVGSQNLETLLEYFKPLNAEPKPYFKPKYPNPPPPPPLAPPARNSPALTALRGMSRNPTPSTVNSISESNIITGHKGFRIERRESPAYCRRPHVRADPHNSHNTAVPGLASTPFELFSLGSRIWKARSNPPLSAFNRLVQFTTTLARPTESLPGFPREVVGKNGDKTTVGEMQLALELQGTGSSGVGLVGLPQGGTEDPTGPPLPDTTGYDKTVVAEPRRQADT